MAETNCAMRSGSTSAETAAVDTRRTGLRLLLAAILFGLCWALPSGAIPLVWYGVAEFDAVAIPAFAPGRPSSDQSSETVAQADQPAADIPGAAGVAAVLVLASVSARASLRLVSGPRPAATARVYHARAPPRQA